MNKRKLRLAYRKYLFSYTFEVIEAFHTKEALDSLSGNELERF